MARTVAPSLTRPGTAGAGQMPQVAVRPSRRWVAPVRMLGFDLIGPLVAYRELRTHSVGTVTALLVAAAFPLVGVLLTAVRARHIDAIGLTVVVGTGAGAVLSLIFGSPRPTLVFTGVLPGFAFAVACLLTVRRTPLIYQIALTYFGGPHVPRGAAFALRWQEQAGFRRYFRRVTLGWGATYLVESAVKTAVVFTTSTGKALAAVGSLSLIVVIALSGWTAAYAVFVQRPARAG
jgi:hypothetical protein